MKKKQQIENRPNYYNGQLLVDKDFLAEQSYHISARRRHNLKLHGSGVVRGLEVVRRSDTSVTVQPGYAIDHTGQEIFLESAEEIDLSEFGPNDIVNVSLMFQEDESTEGVINKSVINTNSIPGFAVILMATAKEYPTEVLLARVKLDSQKKVAEDAIDYSGTQYAGTMLAPGWVRMSCRPIALVNIPKDEEEIPPAFRVGATEALSPKPEKDAKDKGAAGTMAITLPPSVTKILRFRIAGSINEGNIAFSLIRGGWDPGKNAHVSRDLIKETITGGAPFMKTYVIGDPYIDPEYSTLSLWLRSTQRAAISLIAVEVGYY
jgi:hypothetical protein